MLVLMCARVVSDATHAIETQGCGIALAKYKERLHMQHMLLYGRKVCTLWHAMLCSHLRSGEISSAILMGSAILNATIVISLQPLLKYHRSNKQLNMNQCVCMCVAREVVDWFFLLQYPACPQQQQQTLINMT